MPERFASIHEARRLFRVLFVWYNRGHRHSGIAILTPGMVSKARQPVLDAAFERHPERYVNEKPSVGKLPGSV